MPFRERVGGLGDALGSPVQWPEKHSLNGAPGAVGSTRRRLPNRCGSSQIWLRLAESNCYLNRSPKSLQCGCLDIRA